MNASQALLIDLLGRVREHVHAVLDGADEELLLARPAPGSNHIAWLVWHLTRVEDDHLAGLQTDVDQVWTEGWADGFALPFDLADIGYGHDEHEVAAVRPSAELLRGYHDAVHDRAVWIVRGLEDEDHARVVDERWDPPVTLGVRLVSVIDDCIQHAGQAAYVRGLLRRRSDPAQA